MAGRGLPGPEELCLAGPEGLFAHELVVPFSRNPAVAASAAPPPHGAGAPSTRTVARRDSRPDRSGCISRSIAVPRRADGCSASSSRRSCARRSRGAADHWFFLRYGDPDWHLRCGFTDPPRSSRRAAARLTGAMVAAIAPVRCGKLQLDTYEREVERYGGPEGICWQRRSSTRTVGPRSTSSSCSPAMTGARALAARAARHGPVARRSRHGPRREASAAHAAASLLRGRVQGPGLFRPRARRQVSQGARGAR